ncbi:MAG TPA: TonB-dependent receptor plug domain-containing protein [Bacteroidia bacterium]|nr:TonB-dependent receptor plug domain-containing protein [Bacteroidota bacterium]MBP9789574.1 TonB-dependent receptor plug domain-containing protein [Bacteroidia bacterium]HQV98819.1 TonB-dependent receptor plug domain-containing protein [Bacteroidia bacterium]HQW94780.1 TonB-dependent receptor plug domain-containing protein [Saprospiraceae bacterium]
MEIDIKNLTLSDANCDFVKVQWFKKAVLTTKDYTLKVSTASEVSKVYEELSKIKIQELNIENNRNINSISSRAAGLNIRGSRSDETNYYIDGVKMKENNLADVVTFSKIKLEY